MTKREALALFNEQFPAECFVHKQGFLDKPMRDQAWNDFTDGLHKEGSITDRQFRDWTHPWNKR